MIAVVSFCGSRTAFTPPSLIEPVYCMVLKKGCQIWVVNFFWEAKRCNIQKCFQYLACWKKVKSKQSNLLPLELESSKTNNISQLLVTVIFININKSNCIRGCYFLKIIAIIWIICNRSLKFRQSPTLNLFKDINFNLLGYNTYAVRVFIDVSTCDHVNDKVNVLDSRIKEKEHVSNSGNIAVTVASVCAAVGLIVAAIIVCLKCRRAPLSVKKHPSK